MLQGRMSKSIGLRVNPQYSTQKIMEYTIPVPRVHERDNYR